MKGLAVIASMLVLAPMAAVSGCASMEQASNSRRPAALAVSPGQRITFRVHENQTLTIVKVEPVKEDSFLPPDGFNPKTRFPSAAPKGQVVVSLVYDPRIGSLLKVENSGGFNIDYSAVMTVPQGRSTRREATPVCTVVKGFSFYEIWQHPIAMIYLSDFDRYDGPTHCPVPMKASIPNV